MSKAADECQNALHFQVPSTHVVADLRDLANDSDCMRFLWTIQRGSLIRPF
jgi:hypothetical protein